MARDKSEGAEPAVDTPLPPSQAELDRRRDAMAAARRRPGIPGAFEEGSQPPDGMYTPVGYHNSEPSGWAAANGIKAHRDHRPVRFGES